MEHETLVATGADKCCNAPWVFCSGYHGARRACGCACCLGLVSGERRGKEVFWSSTTEGEALCERYRQVREACLMPGFSGAEEENLRIGDLARLLRTLSGRYDQGARAASSI